MPSLAENLSLTAFKIRNKAGSQAPVSATPHCTGGLAFSAGRIKHNIIGRREGKNITVHISDKHISIYKKKSKNLNSLEQET